MNARFLDPKQIEIKGTLYQPKKTQFYHALMIYNDEEGKEVRRSRSTKQTKKSDANRVLAQMVAELREELAKPAPGTFLVDFMEHWINNVICKEVEETTLQGYRRNVYDHIIPYFTPLGLRMRELQPHHIRDFVDAKLESGGLRNGSPMKAHSVKKLHANLKTALDTAVTHELLEFNPARMVKPPKLVPYEASYYSLEELADLWKAVRGTVIEAAVILSSIYGFRRGEICGLKWDMVDFRSRTIRIYETRTTGKGEITKGTKNRQSKRTMPMMAFIEDYLKQLKAKQDRLKAYMGSSWVGQGYVVCYEDGRMPAVGQFNVSLNRVLEKNHLRHIRFHDLRHSVATNLLLLGIPIAEVSAWLGHASIETTSKVYAHVDIGMRMNAARRLDGILGYESPKVEDEPLSIERIVRDLFELGQKDKKAPE